jgi:hypothetical protein
VAGLTALLVFALLSAFLAWVTAEPFWLAARHAAAGTATVTRCAGSGLDRRCVGTFTAADGRFSRVSVPVMGRPPEVGGAAAARMTSARGTHAYVDTDPGRRAALGLGLLLLCGLAIAWGTGARRLATGPARLVAVAGSFTGPLVLFAGMLAATF